MIEIAKKVSSDIKDVAFVVVGNGPQEAELRRTVQKEHLENTVYFLGAKQDVRYCYRDAKVTLVCSLKEGLSLTAYESCAMGVPVVSADVGGQKDLIDRSVGALISCRQTEAESFDMRTFDEEEVDAYVDAICYLLNNSAAWQEASLGCRKKILSGFTIAQMVCFFEEEFQRLVSDATFSRIRRETAAHLEALAPLAEELYRLEMQLQCTEDDLTYNTVGVGFCGTETIPMKIRRVYKQEGIWRVFQKGIAWIRKQLGVYY